MTETQKSICQWADETFGTARAPAALRKMRAELYELLKESSYMIPRTQRLADEMADVVITMYRVAELSGFDLHTIIDAKMQINRRRKWRRRGDGTAEHIEEGESNG